MNTNGLTAAQVAELRKELEHRVVNGKSSAEEYGPENIYQRGFYRGGACALEAALSLLLDAACAARGPADELTPERAVEILTEHMYAGRSDWELIGRHVVAPAWPASCLAGKDLDDFTAVAVAREYLRAAPTDGGETASHESDKDFADRVHHPIDAEYQRGYREGCDDTAAAFVAGPEGIGLEPE